MNVVVFIIISLVVIGFAVYWLLQYLLRRENSREFRIDDREAWAKRWRELVAMLEGDAAQWSVAVIEADKLFDRIMRSMALPGKDFGERLRFLSSSRSALRSVWPAHILRNRLVHESGYAISKREASQALKTFEHALKELGVL